MKILKSVVVCILVICCITSSAFATSTSISQPVLSGHIDDISENGTNVASFVVSEYDMLVNMQSKPRQILQSAGYTNEEINTIYDFSIENAVYERAQLSVEELYGLGYTKEQISILKAYDGSPISDNPQLRGVFADMEGEFDVMNYGTTKMKVKFTWTWSNSPLLSGTAITDVVSCGFAGTNEENLPCVMSVDKANISSRVYYYQGEEGYLKYIGSKRPDVSVKDVHEQVSMDVNMSEKFNINGGTSIGWAKSGLIVVGIKEEKTVNNLYSATFAFGYGHTVATTSPSISVSIGSGFSGGVGLSFGKGTESMFYKSIVIDNTGDYTIYDGD